MDQVSIGCALLLPFGMMFQRSECRFDQMFFALAGLSLFTTVASIGFFKHYLDAKIDPLYRIMERADQRDETLNAYIINHAERIAKLEAMNDGNAV